ncbi:MAG: DUF5681 domain-containing protein [Candidatus Dormibacteria bacterium]
MMMSDPATSKQTHGFQPGTSGNPSGRPRGSRNKATLAAETLLEGEAEALTRKAVELALQGDAVALRLCIERVYPAPKTRKLALDLPADVLADPSSAVAMIQRAVLAGEIDPDTGSKVLDVLTRRSSTADALAAATEHRVPPLAPSMEAWLEFAKPHCDANSGETADK